MTASPLVKLTDAVGKVWFASIGWKAMLSLRCWMKFGSIPPCVVWFQGVAKTVSMTAADCTVPMRNAMQPIEPAMIAQVRRGRFDVLIGGGRRLESLSKRKRVESRSEMGRKVVDSPHLPTIYPILRLAEAVEGIPRIAPLIPSTEQPTYCFSIECRRSSVGPNTCVPKRVGATQTDVVGQSGE